MSAIPVLFSFARSGGTLVNQLLGVHPQCLVLSEANPAASYKPVVEQAVEWLALVEPREAGEFARLPYDRQIGELETRARDKGKRLIVRDWVTVNFLPGAARDHTIPSGQLEQPLYLERAGLSALPLVVARRGAAIHRSITQQFSHLRELDLAAFASAYRAYALAVAAFPKIHLESLRAAPAAAVAEILRIFQLDGSRVEPLLANFHEFRNCTGNTTLQTRSASASARSVLPPEDAARSVQSHAALHPALAEADRLMGYA
ncbi:MAG: hypothetical protein ABI789_13390 [Usitatibacter sp.]